MIVFLFIYNICLELYFIEIVYNKCNIFFDIDCYIYYIKEIYELGGLFLMVLNMILGNEIGCLWFYGDVFFGNL